MNIEVDAGGVTVDGVTYDPRTAEDRQTLRELGIKTSDNGKGGFTVGGKCDARERSSWGA